MQDTLRERGWDCAEAVELHSWMEEFLHRYKTFHRESGETPEELFKSVTDIQNTAVCRMRTESEGIKKFLLNAEDLTQLLKVEEHLRIVKDLQLDLERVLAELRQNAQVVQVCVDKKLAEISAEGARLGELENAAKKGLHKGMGNCQYLAGSKGMEAINKAETAILNMDLSDWSAY